MKIFNLPGGPGSSRNQLLYRLFQQEVAPRRRQYILTAICMAIVAAATSMSAWLMRDVVNQIFVSKDASMLWLISALVAAIFLSKGLAEYGAKVLLGRIGNSITASLRQRFFTHLLRQDLLFFVHANSSRFVAQLIRHVDAVKGTVELIVTGVVRDFLTLLGLVLVMLSQQPTLFALAIPSALAVIWFIRILASSLGKIVRAEHQADVKLIALVQETAQGIRSVKAFNLNRTLEQRFGEFTAESEHRANRINRISALTAPLTEALGGLAIAGVILYGGWMAIDTNETPGEFMAFIAALLLAYEPAKRLSHLKLQLERHIVLVENFYGFLDRKSMIAYPEEAQPVDAERPASIGIHGLCFGYKRDEAPVIEDLDLTLEPGRITAICGPTGSGKSTLIDLLFRFHDPWRGSISIGTHDMREISAAALNAFYAYVGQDIFLFDGSIGDNIRLGRADLSEDQVMAAAKAALVDDFVQEMPEGYDTQVGEKGVRLSGGQRQRIAIARALVKQAPVLVFDEATSALDPTTEQQVLANVRRFHPHHSMVIVSHRIAPLAIADRILVLERGKIVEQGDYAQLTGTRSRFSELFSAQRVDGKTTSTSALAPDKACLVG